MTTGAKSAAFADQIPLPAETLGGVVVAALAQRVRPLALPARVRPAGVAGVVGGLAVVAVAWRERGPGSLEDPSSLVTTRLHSVSRNPMYVGFTAAQLGLAGVTRNGWMLAVCPASAALLHRWVLREERFLRDRFGEVYDAYRDEVPRYLGMPIRSSRELRHTSSRERGRTALPAGRPSL
jgi:protein-S-isoprenylcysteine O-methyltransferase Ste14